MEKGNKVYSTNGKFLGVVEKINKRTICVRCLTWQTKKSFGKNILVCFDKYYFTQEEEHYILYERTPSPKSKVWGRIS